MQNQKLNIEVWKQQQQQKTLNESGKKECTVYVCACKWIWNKKWNKKHWSKLRHNWKHLVQLNENFTEILSIGIVD